MRVFVTGAAGCLGQVLLPALLADARVSTVTAHDLRWINPPHHPRLTLLAGDIRDSRWCVQAAPCDVLIHMAFVVIDSHLGARRRDRALAHAINIEGTKNAISASLAGGARLIHISSASVYGGAARVVREDDPPHPLPGFGYAHDKQEAEALIDAAGAQGLNAIRLRPHIILGPRAQPFLRGLLRAPFYARLAPAPLLQLVHEDDVADAILLSLGAAVQGPVNLATCDALSFADMQRFCHAHPIGLPPRWARAAVRFAFYGLGLGPHPAWSDALDQSLVVDTQKARTQLHWRPRCPTVHSVLAHLNRPAPPAGVMTGGPASPQSLSPP
ncbi:MAG: NAD-dependent epimerase/dehydratase family protein [Gammaproteobacteria bacterium]|nr:NAD-dependent epimerase/dehydratase family protein [Gammaproteobacteria bacterium]